MTSQQLNIGDNAPEFNLPGVDNRNHRLADFTNNVIVVMFTCNHCPYVKAYEDRLIEIQNDYLDKGVSLVAISSNSTRDYPEDGFEEMVIRAREKGYNFLYLRDESQSIATAYGAQYTPEIFVFDKDRRLCYHGRIDDSKDPSKVTSSDLRKAIDALLSGRDIENPETHTFGCSIKWAH